MNTPNDKMLDSIPTRLANTLKIISTEATDATETLLVLEKIVESLEAWSLFPHQSVDDVLEHVFGRDTTTRSTVITADYELIAQIIPEGSKILDLGCGDGMLLELLQRKGVRGRGVEINPDNIIRCIKRGVPVIQSDLDEGLAEYGDATYDYVILNRVLQQTLNVEFVLKEMLRVGKKGIVSFPNFGFWAIRLQLSLMGTMPVSRMLPFNWHDTPNIRLLTINDFRKLAQKLDLTIMEEYYLVNGEVADTLAAPNLFAEEALFVLGK